MVSEADGYVDVLVAERAVRGRGEREPTDNFNATWPTAATTRPAAARSTFAAAGETTRWCASRSTRTLTESLETFTFNLSGATALPSRRPSTVIGIQDDDATGINVTATAAATPTTSWTATTSWSRTPRRHRPRALDGELDTLGVNVENLVLLLGADNPNGTGNASDNLLIGNTGNNH